MRGALVIAAATVLAACQVEVEGARCETPGESRDCPSGQACGNDGKCSMSAAACEAARTRCNVDDLRCNAGHSAVERCVSTVDPACGSWQQTDPCSGQGLVCAQRIGQPPACECPVNDGPEFAADPENTTPAPYPTGVANPKECRFRRLGDALAAAGSFAGAATVRAYPGAGASVVFGSATGETYPVDVPANVTLVGAAGVSDTTISGDAGSSATIVTVRGTVQGVRITNVSMTGTGVELQCDGGIPTLRDVTISATTPKLTKGIVIAGSCGGTLQRVDVSGASGAALDIALPSTAPTVTVSGSRFHGSETGILASGGKLVVQNDADTSSEATDNTGSGIVIGGSGTVDVTLTGVVVARNGGTGFVLAGVPANSTLRMTGCSVHSNATQAPRQYGTTRNAGGILISPQGLLDVFEMRGNQVHSNHGGTFGADAIAFETGSGWPLTTGSCVTANAIGCIGTGYSVSVVGLGTVDAQYTTWPGAAPSTNGFVNTANACSPPWPDACP
jgi:hypothetical protein